MFKQRQWHSVWCHLHTGRGHHRDLCPVRTDTSQRCALIFSGWISHLIFPQMKCWSWHMGSSKQRLYVRNLLDLGCLLPLPPEGLYSGKGWRTFRHPASNPRWGEEPPPFPNDPHLGWRTACQLQANIRDFGDAQLWQLMENLHWEVALRELKTPPREPPLNPWRNLVEMGTPMWMTRRSPFQEGKGGNPEDNHFTPCSHLTRWRCRTCRTPHINSFSGEAMPGKMEVSFEQWHHEVQCVKDHYPETVVWESIVQSLKGGSSRYGQVYGPSHQHGPYPTKINGYFWHCGMVWHPYVKCLQSDAGQPWEGPLLCHKAGRDPQPNKFAVPLEDNWLRGATASQRVCSILEIQ